MSTSLTAQQLAQTFPDQTGMPAPESHMVLFRKRTRERLAEHQLWAVITMLALFIVPAAFIAIGGSPVLGIISAIVLLLIPIIYLWIQWRNAGEAFWSGYGESRGLTVTKGGYLSSSCPLYRKGDEREFPWVLTGNISGNKASLGLYTYTEVSRDSDGDETRTEYDFTVVHYVLPGDVAERFKGVYVRDKAFSFGALQDKLAHDRSVKFASAELGKQYSIRVDDDQDDIALYELFSTTFIDRLVREFRATWEQRGHDLIVFEKGHKTSTAELDEICSRSANVLQRYLEEYQ